MVCLRPKDVGKLRHRWREEPRGVAHRGDEALCLPNGVELSCRSGSCGSPFYRDFAACLNSEE
jgi:hypothetical protein